jgi:hypothetical protein
MSNSLEFEKQCYQYLNRLNQCFIETPHTVAVSKYALGEELGFDSHQTDRIVKFLLNKNALKGDSGSVRITGNTVQCLIDYERANNKAPSSNSYNINVGSMNTSSIVQASKDVQIITILSQTQIQDVEQISSSLKEVLKSSELSEEQKAELNIEIESLDVQLKSPKPKMVRIKDYLTTAKNIIEGTAIGSMVATKIATLLSTLG